MWSISIYLGDSPFCLGPAPGLSGPVLTRENVTDVPARFVADPFMLNVGGLWHMFFEVMNEETRKGEIGLATSENGLSWQYSQIVLSEPFHLSYPYVFEWDHEHYMIPETFQPGTVRLYKADRFPTRWSFVGSLFAARCADPSIFHFKERWWMFTCSRPYNHDTLRLYSAERLLGPWVEHPTSPIVNENKKIGRPAGRVVAIGDKVFRFAQDCVTRYGNQVRALEILELTTKTYREEERQDSPILKAGDQGWWNELGMHHIDPHPLATGGWMACVDGLSGVE